MDRDPDLRSCHRVLLGEGILMDTNKLMELAQRAGIGKVPGGWVASATSLAELAHLIRAAERDRIATWAATQRNDIPATGEEFAAAIRAMKD